MRSAREHQQILDQFLQPAGSFLAYLYRVALFIRERTQRLGR
jgi:hypothetical protein